GLDAALLLEPLENQPGQVPGEGCRGVVHRAVVGGDLVVEHGRATGTGATQQVFAHDHHHQAARADVLLRTRIDQAVFRHIDGARQNVRRHVHYQRYVAHFRHPVELQAAYGLVAGVVQVGGVLGQLPLVLPGNGEVVVGLGAGGDIDGAVATRL